MFVLSECCGEQTAAGWQELQYLAFVNSAAAAPPAKSAQNRRGWIDWYRNTIKELSYLPRGHPD